MGRKPKPPTEPQPANIRDMGPDKAARVSCWHCRLRLPGLFPPSRDSVDLGLSDGRLRLDATDTEGWTVDGNTLRLTHREQEGRAIARENVRRFPHQAASDRRKLAGDARSPFSRKRNRNWLPHEPMPDAPESIECPDCHAVNLIAPHGVVR